MALPPISKPKGHGQPSPKVQPRQPRGRTDMTPDDDDIQDYVRPWVGLTDEEIEEIRLKTFDAVATNHEVYRAIEAKLKEKNT